MNQQHTCVLMCYMSIDSVPQEKREKEEAAAAENTETPESTKEGSESKEQNSEGKADGSEASAGSAKEVAINLRPLTMDDLKEAKNQVSRRRPDAQICLLHTSTDQKNDSSLNTCISR
jgi:hypothetical protein